MALHGFDVPTGKSTSEIVSRRDIFSIACKYVMSVDDIAAVREYPLHLQDLWLLSFTATQKAMLLVNLQKAAKIEFLKVFPSYAMVQSKLYTELLGLEPGMTILDR